ncbi:hypothetical protein L596_014523 [Steinernema carpocapsae]|uniref:G-protein coupled receptors family 1 profile domain-containing protein n=1 Tax=Steinernema carpocapsae TaxID=34508 RepID=A0A4U5NCZ3_STECR|nr:hypothetical protein L596_014523 [Steinernema carpocapsae]
MNNESCEDFNDELWTYRHDLTTRPAVMALFALLYTVIIVVGFVGNTCVILAISRTKSLQSVPNLFILSLSCSDVVVSCTSATITPITAFKKIWIFGSMLCSFAPFIAGISLCFSTFTLTAISIDRFMLIRFPMKKPLSKVQALLIIFMICTLASCLSMPIMVKQTLKSYGSFCGRFCVEDWGEDQGSRRAYGTVMVFVQFIVPLTIICISYTAISLRLDQSILLKKKRNDYEWQVTMTDQQRAALKRRQRTNRMLIGMVVAFSASWFWSVLFNVLRDYDFLPEFVKSQEYLFGIATHCIAMTSTVWNPLLYALLNPQLRAAFIELMPECLRCHMDRGRLFSNGASTRNPQLLTTSAKTNGDAATPNNSVGDTTARLEEKQTNESGHLRLSAESTGEMTWDVSFQTGLVHVNSSVLFPGERSHSPNVDGKLNGRIGGPVAPLLPSNDAVVGGTPAQVSGAQPRSPNGFRRAEHFAEQPSSFPQPNDDSDELLALSESPPSGDASLKLLHGRPCRLVQKPSDRCVLLVEESSEAPALLEVPQSPWATFGSSSADNFSFEADSDDSPTENTQGAKFKKLSYQVQRSSAAVGSRKNSF